VEVGESGQKFRTILRKEGGTRASFVTASYTVKSDNRKASYSFGGRQGGREIQKGK
jgi:hypothetical protein